MIWLPSHPQGIATVFHKSVCTFKLAAGESSRGANARNCHARSGSPSAVGHKRVTLHNEARVMVQVDVVIEAIGPSNGHKEEKGLVLNACYCLAGLASCPGCLSSVLDKGVSCCLINALTKVPQTSPTD
jgi:hypothetical protein